MSRTEPTIIIEADEDDVPRVARTVEELAESPDFWEAAEELRAAVIRQAYGLAQGFAAIAAEAYATAVTPYARELHPHTAPKDDGVDTSEVDAAAILGEVRDESARHGFEWIEWTDDGRLTIRADGRVYSFNPERWPDDEAARAWLLGWVSVRRLEASAIEAVRAGRFNDAAVRKIVDRDREASRSTRLSRMTIQHEGTSYDPTDPFVWGGEWGSGVDIEVKRRVIAEGTFVHPDGQVYSALDREVAAAELLDEAERDERAFSRLPALSTSDAPTAPAKPKVTAAEIEARVLRFVKMADEAGEPLSKNKVRDRVSGGSAAIDAALIELVNRGELVTEAGPRNATLYRVAPKP